MTEVLRLSLMLPFLCFVFLFVWFERKWTHSFMTVHTAFVGLKYVKGVFTGVLQPGRYRIKQPKESLTLVYMGHQYLTVGGQEIFTAEQAQIKISLLLVYQIVDAPLAMHQQENLQQVVYSMAQLALREQVQQMTLDACFKETPLLQQQLRVQLQERLRALGVDVLQVYLKDLMLSGELKRAYHQVLVAQKEAQAALERARGEQANLRSLANAARQMEKNPMLLHLRWLQGLEQAKNGHTVHLSLPQGPNSPNVSESEIS